MAARNWSQIIAKRRLPVRSSQPPRSGAVIRLGNVTQATVAPAMIALPVRSSTCRTTATESISSAIRADVAAAKKLT